MGRIALPPDPPPSHTPPKHPRAHTHTYTNPNHRSCGYRNLQMLASALLRHPDYARALFGGSGFVPQVQFLQRWIEWAWSQGFDPLGASQLRTWMCDCLSLYLYVYVYGLRSIDLFERLPSSPLPLTTHINPTSTHQ